jgi:hypothetical protein
MRSFKTRDDRFRIQSYLSHGFGNKSWNYGVSSLFLAGFKPRWVVGLSTTNDIQQMGGKLMQENQLLLDQFANAILKRGDNHFLTSFENHSLFTEVAFHENLPLSLLAYHKKVASAHSGLFPMGYLSDQTIKSNYDDVGVEASLYFTPTRRVYGYGVQQRFGRFRYPTTALKFKIGISGFLDCDLKYKQL